MYKAIEFEVVGAAPLLMHNGQLADPLNKFSKELKKVSGKKKKTDEDYAEMSRIEFMGGLYTDDKGRLIIPGEMLEANIVNGAKNTKKGKQARAGILVDGNFPLDYDGPKDAAKLFEDENFRYVVGVKVKQARIMRTRPKFNQWGLKFTVHYLPSAFDPAEIIEFVTTAGRVAGLGDNRPRFGRYDVVSSKAL